MTPTPTPIRECDQALDYLYSMLEGDDKARFETHLATCTRCKDELASFGSVRKIAQEALAPVEPSGRLTGALHQQLMHAAAQRKPRGKIIPLLRRVVSHPGYAAAAAFLLVGGAVGVQWTRGRLLMPPAAESAPAATPVTVATPPAPLANPEAEAKADAKPAAVHSPKEIKEEKKHVADELAGEDLVAPSGSVSTGKNKEKSLPVTMAEPAKATGAFKGRSDNPANVDRDAWDKRATREGQVAQDDESKAITAQLKKGKSDSGALDNALAGLGGKDGSGVAQRSATSSYGNGNGNGSGGAYRAPATAKPAPAPAPAMRQAQAPAEPRPAQSTPVAKAPAPKIVSANNEPLADAPQLESTERARVNRRAPTAEEAPPPPPPASPAASTRGYATNSTIDSKTVGPSDSNQAQGDVKTELAAKDGIDTDRTRASQLAQNGRCDEATAIYARLEKATPQRLSDADRLSYAKCLRVLGRNTPAQQELDAIRNNRAQQLNQAGAAPAVEAEQKALAHASRKQADVSASRAERQQRPAHAAKKKRNAAAAMDDAAPAETNVKKVYSY